MLLPGSTLVHDAQEWTAHPNYIRVMFHPNPLDVCTGFATEDANGPCQNLSWILVVWKTRVERWKLRSGMGLGVYAKVGRWPWHSKPTLAQQSTTVEMAMAAKIVKDIAIT